MLPASEPAHLVQLHDQEEFLVRVVADFLEPGLEAGVPLVVIATGPHRRGFAEALEARGHDVALAQAAGLLTLLDARECLSTFMVGGRPDRELFDLYVGGLVKAASARSPTGSVRAYGEMVEVLHRDENDRAALELERMWNALGEHQAFTLLCAYGPSGGPQIRESRSNRAPADGAGPPADLLEHAPEGVHSLGPDGRIVWANRADLELLGYPKDRYVGRHISEFHVDVALCEHLLRRLAAGETLVDQDVQLKCADGTVKDVLLTSNALVRDGKLVHTRCFTRDVTRLKGLQRELQARNDELTRSLRAADQFVNLLGHDLRNPLSAIMTAAGLMRRRSDSELVMKPTERILSSANRMARMVDQLLDFARARLGRGFHLEKVEANLADVGRAVVKDAGSPRVVLDVEGDASGTFDSDRLTQLLKILVGNALTHGDEDGSVSVRVNGTDAERLAVAVHNRGAIPPDVLPRLFELRENKREGTSGLGLGLYVCQQIALAHGGTLEVQSDEQQGTRFSVILPRKG